MSFFNNRKISASDNLHQALTKKSNNSSISQKSLNKINEKLNSLKTISEVNSAKAGLSAFSDKNVSTQILGLINANSNVKKIIAIANIRSIKITNKPLIPHTMSTLESPEREIHIDYQWENAISVSPLQKIQSIYPVEHSISRGDDTQQNELNDYASSIGEIKKCRRVGFSEKTIVAQIPSDDKAAVIQQEGERLHDTFQPYNIKLTENDIRKYLNIVYKMILKKYTPTQIQDEMVYYMQLLPSFCGFDHTRTMYRFLAEEKSDKLFNNIYRNGFLYRDPRTISAIEVNKINPDNPVYKTSRHRRR